MLRIFVFLELVVGSVRAGNKSTNRMMTSIGSMVLGSNSDKEIRNFVAKLSLQLIEPMIC